MRGRRSVTGPDRRTDGGWGSMTGAVSPRGGERARCDGWPVLGATHEDREAAWQIFRGIFVLIIKNTGI